MEDKSGITSSLAAAAMAPLAQPSANPSPFKLDEEAAWKSDFRRTLNEINDKGFSSYADKIQEKKLEELREKILASMGLSEQDLENMPPAQREQIEKMVALEMQERLASEDALDAGSGEDTASGSALMDQLRAAPNGLGAAVLLLQAIDQNRTPDEPTG